ncbi:MAG: plasmid pRiA4b ORF-3 family protein [Deltaproteobacteria bacterium]|jgi:hypothetical protein|nr:plasmid pRiA4b ORF-3 family protein [Deltaproteobacteria bacterium]
MAGKHFLLEVSLDEVEPEIWRIFVVPRDFDLVRLRQCLKIVMGWAGGRMRAFVVGRRTYLEDNPEMKEMLDDPNDRVLKKITEDKSGLRRPVDDDREFKKTGVTLTEVFKRKGSKISFEYDFEDCWTHAARLLDPGFDPEKSLPGVGMPPCGVKCLDGARARPPENIGGPVPRAVYCEGMEDEDHPGREAFTGILLAEGGPNFDPEKFDVAEVSKTLGSVFG